VGERGEFAHRIDRTGAGGADRGHHQSGRAAGGQIRGQQLGEVVRPGGLGRRIDVQLAQRGRADTGDPAGLLHRGVGLAGGVDGVPAGAHPGGLGRAAAHPVQRGQQGDQ
jgi:hypothetical protein